MRFAVSALLGIHGLIHLMGFLKVWRPAAVAQLSGHTIAPLSESAFRVVGVLWLVAAVALVIAAGLRARNWDSWWVVVAPALALSQALVVLQWGDARAGTVANVVLVLAVAVGAGMQGFRATDPQHARALLAKASLGDPPIVRAEDIAHLPLPARRWLEPRVRSDVRARARSASDSAAACAPQPINLHARRGAAVLPGRRAGLRLDGGRDDDARGARCRSGHICRWPRTHADQDGRLGRGRRWHRPNVRSRRRAAVPGEIVWCPSAALAPTSPGMRSAIIARRRRSRSGTSPRRSSLNSTSTTDSPA